ncbi:MAG: serine/threonine protein kinase, partial [Deltaproteobacteria bacterium]|nr:serine/threonine protein kinase [Deltaproteobacteria bacterium]
MSQMRDTFGKYRLDRRLAFGGMAEVYLASVHGEAGFSKTVVIKRLHPRLSEDSEFVQMLIDEARITSQLTHSNICQVLDLGSVDDAYYIAMEFIAGEDLRTLQDHFGRLGEYMPIDAVLYIVGEMLAGLDYAHVKEGPDGDPLGVVHRDVSPQNVLVSYEGEVKVIDFGIAKAKSRLVETQVGVIKGKFRYMSPEQASGQVVDARTDVFAAGVVLYELLQGKPHSRDIPDTEVLRRMRSATFEPIARSREDVPDALFRIVSRALARKQNKRFPSAAEFRQAVLKFARGRPHAFGRSDLAALMKTVFPSDRRRERSGHSTKSRHEEPISASPVGEGRGGVPSRRAVAGEIGERRSASSGPLALARTAHSNRRPLPVFSGGVPRERTEPMLEKPAGRVSEQTRAERTGRRSRQPPGDGTQQLEMDDLEVVSGRGRSEPHGGASYGDDATELRATAARPAD